MSDTNPRLITEQQQKLLKAIFDEQETAHSFDPRGMDIYRRNLRATASQALRITYPTVFKLIGEPLFQFASDKLLQLAPPGVGDWGMWGAELDQVLSSITELEDYPYVADSARLDWILHQTERSADMEFDSSTLNLLMERDLDEIFVGFPASTALIKTDFPVIEVWYSNHSDHSEQFVERFNQRFEEDQLRQSILVYRPQFRAAMKELDEQQYKWFAALMNGKSIGHALDDMDTDSFSFEQWLAEAVQNKFISALQGADERLQNED